MNGKLLGAQIVGYNGVDKRIDEFSQVIKHQFIISIYDGNSGTKGIQSGYR